jgi:hypothetical protein
MVIIADKNGQADSAYHTLVRHIKSELPIVMVSWAEKFEFNPKLLDIKDFILICFCEYGYDANLVDTHIWGRNSDKFPRYYNGGWIEFDNWVKDNPPKLLLKRELLKKDVSDLVKPIEYGCLIDEYPVHSEVEFNSRQISAFQYWGRSNEHRVRIHSEIWLHAYKKGFQPCDSFYYVPQYLNQEQGEKWITLWIPHWARMDINNLMPINGNSKLSLSWPGAGFKCFRTSEAPVNSVMVMYKNDFCFSYDWNESNCILVEPGKEIEGIEKALKNPNLYTIYLEGLKTVDKYRPHNYIPFLEKIINERI